MDLTTAAREMHELLAERTRMRDTAKAEEARLTAEIAKRAEVLWLDRSGLDADKIALAKTIISVRGSYKNGGDARASVIEDAVKQLSTGLPVRARYGDLWHVKFGTKRYEHWHGQRCDCDYGFGPKHGSIIFSVGLTDSVRMRKPRELNPDETEAAIYYLSNLERVQDAERSASADGEG